LRVRRLSFAVVFVVLVPVAACTRGTREPGDAGGARVSDVPAAATTSSDPWLLGTPDPSTWTGTPRKGGTLTVRLYAEPPSLDRFTDSDYVIQQLVNGTVQETLARVDGTNAPEFPLEPLLAERWEIADEGRSVTFFLRRGVRWHDGSSFTGHDVVASLQKVLDPKVRSMHLRSYLEELASFDVDPADDHVVRTRWKRPYFMAFRFLATSLPLLPKHALDASGDLLSSAVHRAPIGTGPFKFESWKTGDRLTFTRNDAYWGRPAHLDRLVFRVVAEEAVAFQLLQKGEFDLYLKLSPRQWTEDMPALPALRESYRRVRFFFPNYSWIGWNLRSPLFSDVRVRRALSLLLDRDGLLRHYLQGVDAPATCHFFRDSTSCDPSIVPTPHDPREARRLLDEAGWIDHDGDGVRENGGNRLEFTYLIPASSTFGLRLGAWMQQEYAKHGIAMEVKKVEWSVFVQELREHRFGACMLAWAYNDAVIDPFQIWHSSQAKGGSNYVSFADPEADALIEQARTTLDDTARNALFRKLSALLYDRQPYAWLFTRPHLDAVKTRVHGLRPSLAWYRLADAWVED